jgi:8-oxo-dGTP pyrophosphatase MutT (NUDIX family)
VEKGDEMWLFTTFGFFSVVQKEPSDDFLTVRARYAADLDRLRERVPRLSATVAGGGSDYPYRAKIPHADLALALSDITRAIGYSNFKNAAGKELGQVRAQQLHEVWHVMSALGREVTKPSKHERDVASAAADAFGGVVIDARNQLLLREPNNHYGGYVWTFAKGHPDPGETPEQTALREVREELGVEARIVKALPGVFEGDTSKTQFFLMRHVRDIGKPSDETRETRWVSSADARLLIQKTKTIKGRQRDLAVLGAVEELLRVL